MKKVLLLSFLCLIAGPSLSMEACDKHSNTDRFRKALVKDVKQTLYKNITNIFLPDLPKCVKFAQEELCKCQKLLNPKELNPFMRIPDYFTATPEMIRITIEALEEVINDYINFIKFLVGDEMDEKEFHEFEHSLRNPIPPKRTKKSVKTTKSVFEQ